MNKVKILTTFAILSLCCGCRCGNKEIFDTTRTYDRAICSIGGEWKEIKVSKWSDYEGEQIQIWDENGDYYLMSSVNCTLIND